MRIVQVIPTYLPAVRYGGPIITTHALCAALAALGQHVQVVTTNVDGPGESPVPLDRPVALDGVEVHYYPVPHLRRLYWSSAMARGLWQILNGASVLHLHSVFLAPTSLAAASARHHHVPYLLAPRGALVPELFAKKSRHLKTAWLQLVERQTLHGAAYLHVTSEAEYADAARLHVPLPPACVVPNGVDVPDFERSPAPSARLEALTRERYVLFLGRLSWKKGLDRLIAALPGTRLRLLLAGNDDEHHTPVLLAQAQALGVAAQVEPIGPVTGADKHWLLRRARCLALTSYNENFGNVVVEAMAAGTPVVVTPEVAAQSHVQAARAGIVVRGEPEPLRQALLSYWMDETRRARDGAAGLAYVREHLSWSGVARQLLDRYEELVRESKRWSPPG